MIREIVLDTETTGLDPVDGHRVVEVGAIELINHVPSGKVFHRYYNPGRPMPEEAFAVHGLSDAFLADKPRFEVLIEELDAFLGDSPLIIHNAAFDCKFLAWEYKAAGRPFVTDGRVVDTLQLARQRHPMGPNSLDALCRRYGIDNSRRTQHGALLDAELLAEVYLELIGGRQTALVFGDTARRAEQRTIIEFQPLRARPTPLPLRLTAAEQAAHTVLVNSLGPANLWASYRPDPDDVRP
ncbi:MAG: DNA polymerase III subunit epsilon [Hyphomicrobiales bacterium]